MEGSLTAEKETVADVPSPTGPLLPSVPVGATLFTTTVVVYWVSPPSWSMMAPLTVWLLGPSSKVHVEEPVVFGEPA